METRRKNSRFDGMKVMLWFELTWTTSITAFSLDWLLHQVPNRCIHSISKGVWCKYEKQKLVNFLTQSFSITTDTNPGPISVLSIRWKAIDLVRLSAGFELDQIHERRVFVNFPLNYFVEIETPIATDRPSMISGVTDDSPASRFPM